MSRILVMIPTRDRPELARKAAESVLATSTKADVMFYVDTDQSEVYRSTFNGTFINQGQRVQEWIGSRIGPAAAANVIASRNDYDAYGLLTDDSQIVTPGWDEWLLSVFNEYPLAVVSPRHNLGEHVDMPFVSKRWINLTGWYACPGMYHYCWPIISGLIGEMTCIVHAGDAEFALRHEGLPHTNLGVREKDAQAFFEYVSLKLPGTVHVIREAMAA